MNLKIESIIKQIRDKNGLDIDLNELLSLSDNVTQPITSNIESNDTSSYQCFESKKTSTEDNNDDEEYEGMYNTDSDNFYFHINGKNDNSDNINKNVLNDEIEIISKKDPLLRQYVKSFIFVSIN